MKIMDLKIFGLKCDNPECNYFDKKVKLRDYQKYLNKPCPKCGSPLLTQEDYDTVQNLIEANKIINSIPRNFAKKLKNKLKTIQKFSMNGSGKLEFMEPEISEKRLNEAEKNLTDVFEEIFWSIYRNDTDMNILKSNIIECELATEESYSIIFDSINNCVEEFKNKKDQSNDDVREIMTKLVKVMKISYPEMITNQFEFI